MTALVLTAMVTAAGLWWLGWLLLPHHADPVTELARIDAAHHTPASSPRPITVGADADQPPSWWGRWQEQIGALTARLLTQRGITAVSLRRDLAMLGRPVEGHLGGVVLTGVTGALLATTTLIALTTTMGVHVAPVVAVVVIVGTAGGFAALPGLQVRQEARRQRRSFRHALASFLDLVAMSLAGGRGLNEALLSSACVGTGSSFQVLAAVLRRARDLGEGPWVALAELGTRIGVEELRELSGAVELVSGSGSKIRGTLTARAATLRRRQISDSEGIAAEREHALRIAQLVIGFGFVVFLGYPAVINVLSA